MQSEWVRMKLAEDEERRAKQQAEKQLKTTHPSGIFGLAKVIGGHQFKPDAQPNPDQKLCARCGRHEGVAWIAGAGEYLCYKHQDDY